MNKNLLTLNELPIGSTAVVKELDLDGPIRRRILDLGLIYNTNIKSLGESPSGDPIAYEIRGATIALRSEESSKILVELVSYGK